MMRRALLASLLVVSSCGLAGEDQAELIAAEDVDYELLGTTTSTTSTTVVAQPTAEALFYWHAGADDGLRVIVRGLDAQPDPASTLLDLVAGPTASDLEKNPDLVARVDESMQPELIGPDENGQVQIRIQRPAEEALTTDQAAEFVCTATQFSSISSVLIVDAEGVPFSLSGLGAVAIQGAAQRSDFGDCTEDLPPGEAEAEASNESTTTGG